MPNGPWPPGPGSVLKTSMPALETILRQAQVERMSVAPFSVDPSMWGLQWNGLVPPRSGGRP